MMVALDPTFFENSNPKLGESLVMLLNPSTDSHKYFPLQSVLVL